MSVLVIALDWIHLLGAVLFLGTMFVGTFVLLPALKTTLERPQRRNFIVHFIPRVRSIMRIVISILVVTGIARLLLPVESSGTGGMYTGVLVIHIVFAAIPILIFAAAPRILGVKSEDGLCCDPDADDPPIFKGLMSSKGATLHYIAISGGWLAILAAVVRRHL